MKLQKRKPTGREKDEDSVRLLARLREKLHADDVSTARRAAFNLSWMQEDGLDILKEALFSKVARRTKSAAAYGLRKMRGRMEKLALKVFKQGLAHSDHDTKSACSNALSQMDKNLKEKASAEKPPEVGNFKIKEIPSKSRQKKQSRKKSKNQHLMRGRGSSKR